MIQRLKTDLLERTKQNAITGTSGMNTVFDILYQIRGKSRLKKKFSKSISMF